MRAMGPTTERTAEAMKEKTKLEIWSVIYYLVGALFLYFLKIPLASAACVGLSGWHVFAAYRSRK